MAKDGRNCMLNSSPMSKTGLTVADSSDNVELFNKFSSAIDPQDCIVGKRVYVGGTRPGVIAYIGETHFAPGDWVGIVLDDPNGKNDGCVSGKRYFQCEAKRGVFSRLNRLTFNPINDSKRNSTSELDFDIDRLRAVSPSMSMKSSQLKSPSAINRREVIVGDRVIVSSGFGSRLGELKFLGETQFAPGTWCGVQLDEPNGKNDGSVDGTTYFTCPVKYGIFVPISKVTLSPSSKKIGLSRMGSRESLTSIGTVNSVATTNTSRLRMSLLKRPSQSVLLPQLLQKTPGKPSFSMQDVIREKQNYIEQLMTERELDREDVQNQNLRHQKEIDEMKDKILILEIKLDKRKKQGEELKNSIDETTFCNDEINAQNQVYKEKILVLEKTLFEIDPNALALIDYQKLENTEKIDCQNCKDKVRENTELKSKVENYKKDLENTINSAELNFQLNEKSSKISDLEVNVGQLESDKEFLEIEFKKLKEESNEIQKIISLKDIETNQYRKKIENLEKENSDLKIKVQEIGNINIDLESEVIQVKDEIKKKDIELQSKDLEKNELTALNLTNSEMEKKLMEVEKDKEKLRNELEIQTKQCKNLGDQKEQELNEFQRKINSITEENNLLNISNRKLETLNQNLTNESGKIKSEFESIQSQLKSLTESKNVQSKTSIKLETEVQNVREELSKKEKENDEQLRQITNLEKNLSILKNDKEDLKTEIKNAKHDYLELETVKNQEKIDHLAKLEHLQIEKSELLKRNQEINFKSESLEEDLKSLKETSKINQIKLDTMIKSKEEILEQFNELNSTHNNTINEITNKEEQLNICNNKIVEFERMLEQINSEKITLEKQFGESKQDGEVTNKLKNEELNILNEKITSVQNQNNDLKAKVSDISNLKEILELELQNLTTKYNVQESEFKSSVNNISKSDNLINSLEKVIAEKEFKLSEFSKQFNELEKTISDMNMEKNVLENNLIKTNENLENIKQINQEQNAELNEYKINSLNVQNENDELNNKIKETVEESTELKAEIQKLSTQLNDLTSALSNKETENKEFNQLLLAHKIIKEQVIQKENQLTEKNSKISEFESSLSQMKTEKENLENVLQKVENDVLELKKLREQESDDYKLKLENKNSEFKSKLSEMSTINLNQNSELQKLLIEKQNLEVDLNAALASKALENNQYVDLRATYKIIQEDLIQKDNQIKDKIQNIMNLEKEFLEITKIKENLEEDIQKLQECFSKNQNSQIKELNELRTKLEHSEQINSDLNNKIIQNCEQNKKLEEEISTLKNEKMIDLNLLKQLKKSNADDQSQCEELELKLQLKIQECDKLSDNFKNMAEEKNNLEIQLKLNGSKLENLESELIVKNKKCYELEQNIIDTESDLNEKEIKIKEIENIFSELRYKNDLLLNDFNQTKNKSEEMSALTTQKNNEFLLKLEDLQTENNELTKTNESVVSDLQLLQSQFEIQENNIKSSTKKIEELTTENFDLQIKYSETNDLLLTVQNQLLAVQSEYNNIQNSSKSLQHKFEKELVVEKCELERAAKAVHDIKIELDNLHEDKKNLIEINEQLKKTLAQMEQEKQDAVNNAEMFQIESENIIDEIKTKNSEYKVETELLKQKVFMSENSIESLNKDLMAKSTIEIQLKNEIDKLKKPTSIKIPQSMEQNESNDSVDQINFLNSIIADMHKKNEILKTRIDTLESPLTSTDFFQHSSLEMYTKRKPAPRLFCDICDEFDSHDTEDCPIQASDSPTESMFSNPNKIKPPPRKYCESCEEFGHESGECPNEECF